MIPIKNIYYMLSYAFQVLQEQGYKNLATEEFKNTSDLFAAILAKGIANQIKRGIGRDYISYSDSISTLHGKINVSESIKTQSFLKRQMVCSYDEFSTNIYLNQIIKSTVFLLMHSDISKNRKKELRKLMVFFSDVELLDIRHIRWNIQYNRTNKTYQMMISICYLVAKGLLQSQENGTMKLMDFLDEQRMCRLYEKFILEYYKKEHPEVNAHAAQIQWQLDDDFSEMLPIMQTDIMLTYKEKILIIDAKYYSHTTQQQYGIHTLHSGNLYQIFTYVKNKEYELRNVPHSVSGVLLYTKTDEMLGIEQRYKMSGNMIAACVLDLNVEFEDICGQLDDLIEEFILF